MRIRKGKSTQDGLHSLGGPHVLGENNAQPPNVGKAGEEVREVVKRPWILGRSLERDGEMSHGWKRVGQQGKAGYLRNEAVWEGNRPDEKPPNGWVLRDVLQVIVVPDAVLPMTTHTNPQLLEVWERFQTFKRRGRCGVDPQRLNLFQLVRKIRTGVFEEPLQLWQVQADQGALVETEKTGQVFAA